MTKKKVWVLIGVSFITCLALAIVYWFYFSKPTSFPPKEQLIEEMNSIFPKAEVSEIQDILSVDDRHVLVPYISENEDHGLCYWVWEQREWRVASIDSSGRPMVWKLDNNDPSSYYFVWNIHPDTRLSSIHFYLIKDRGYRITEGTDYYSPRVQMETSVPMNEKSYGFMQLPDEWVVFMNAFEDVEQERQYTMFPNYFSFEQFMSFGWVPYDQSDNETLPERSLNGSGYSNGNIDLEHVMFLGKGDLETPEID